MREEGILQPWTHARAMKWVEIVHSFSAAAACMSRALAIRNQQRQSFSLIGDRMSQRYLGHRLSAAMENQSPGGKNLSCKTKGVLINKAF